MHLNSILNEIEKGNESSDLITGYMDLFKFGPRRSYRRNRKIQYTNSEKEKENKRNKNNNGCCNDCEFCCDCGFLSLLSCDGKDDCCCGDCDCNCCE